MVLIYIIYLVLIYIIYLSLIHPLNCIFSGHLILSLYQTDAFESVSLSLKLSLGLNAMTLLNKPQELSNVPA